MAQSKLVHQRFPFGIECRDVLTGFQGRVYGYTTFWTGCDRVGLVAAVEKEGERPQKEIEWFDVDTVEVVSGEALELPGDRLRKKQQEEQQAQQGQAQRERKPGGPPVYGDIPDCFSSPR